jgi:uncharacterized coiled-coil DUF342 family protein
MNNDEMSTTPTIETLLGRLNEWGEQFTNEFNNLKNEFNNLKTVQQEHGNVLGELRKGQDELRKGQDELRNDLNAGLRRVERKIEILNDNILTVNADNRDVEVRLEKLEAESLIKN